MLVGVKRRGAEPPAEPPTSGTLMLGGRRAAGAIRRTVDSIPPASGAEVMGAGIVSIALSLDGAVTLSAILLVIDAVSWVVLVVLLVARIVRNHHAHVSADARTPAALTAVAGSAVLGTRLVMLGWAWAGVALLVISLLAWAALLTPVLTHWSTPTRGASLLLSVSTESLAVLALALAVSLHSAWLLFAALVPFGLGLAAYVFVIARFDLRQLTVGSGDQWIGGGALAICALAAARLTTGARSLDVLGGDGATLQILALVVWVLATVWLPALVTGELAHLRLRFHVRRWSTVFPLGMYAAASFAVGSAVSSDAVTRYARAWVWVALAVWALVSAGTLRRGWWLVRGAPRSDSSRAG